MTSASAKMLFGRRQPTARSTKDVNSSAEIIDDTPDNSPMVNRVEEVLPSRRIATPRSPQVVFETDEEDGDDDERGSDQVSDSDDNEPLARRVSFTEDSESNDDTEPAIKGQYRGLVRGRHDDSIDSPMVRSTMQRTCPDSLDTPISSNKPQTSRFASAGPSPMSGVGVRSPTKRSPAVHNMSTDQVSGSPGSSRRRSKPSRRSAASVSVSSGSGSDEDDEESPAVVRSLKKRGGRKMRLESSDSDDDESLVKSAVPRNKSRLGEESGDEEEMGSTEEEDENMSRSFVAKGGFMSESSDEEELLSDDEDFIVKDDISKDESTEESYASAEEPHSRPASSNGNFDATNKQILTPPPTITPPKSSPSPPSNSALSKSAVLLSPGGAGDDSIVQITPPKSSPNRSIQLTPPSPLPIFKPQPKPSVPKKRWEDEEDVIEVSSSDEDEFNEAAVEESINMPQAQVTNLWNNMEVREVENSVDKLAKAIAANQVMLKAGGLRLPDGGASLRRTIEQDTLELGKQRKRLAELRGRSGGSVLGAVPKTNSMFKPPSQFQPINNQPTTELLERARREKEALLKSLDYGTNLADGGAKIQQKLEDAEARIEKLEAQVAEESRQAFSNAGWNKNKGNFQGTAMSNEEMLKQALEMQGQGNLYGGRMTADRRQEVKAVTHSAMEGIHKALETMPGEGDMEEQPKGLRSKINLFEYQRHALAWLEWREEQEPRGGILADDMGLGKTLTMISLILRHRERLEAEGSTEKGWTQGGKLGGLVKSNTTLIICPASLLGQWSGEVESKVKSGHLRVLTYHGTNRKVSARQLAKYDLVITTYGTVSSEVKGALGKDKMEKEGKGKMDDMKAAEDNEHVRSNESELLNVFWERIILDEAHQVRNPKAICSLSVCKLTAVRRWCVTGTPIQNKELDLYSLVRFLRFKPFDEYQMWKKWIVGQSPQAQDRMKTLVRSMMLRRTKDQKSKMTGKELVALPEKHIVEHKEELSEEERKVFSKVMEFSKRAVEKFMEKSEEKKMGMGGGGSVSLGGAVGGALGAAADWAFQAGAQPGLATMAGGKDGEVKAHHILVLLLRLRQICNHPGLIKAILAEEEKEQEGLEGDADLVSAMEDLGLEGNGVKKVDEVLNMENPVFNLKKESTKIKIIVEEISRLVEKKEEEGVMEKVIVVSQWTSMLDVIKEHLSKLNIKHVEISGKIPVKARGDIVDQFNQKDRGAQLMLLSLGAGGVGLNLVGANHLFLVDCHWNPQLEAQACDRIYRVGQKREVFIHRFIMKDTVEEKIMALQEKKLKLADGVLTGAKRTPGGNKLTMQELTSLFS